MTKDKAPIMSKERDKPWYERSFRQDYLTIYSHRDFSEAKKHIDLFEEIIPVRRGMTILDLGCGFGRHTLELSRRHYRAVGLDLSDYLLKHAMEQSKTENSLVRFVLADMRAIPFIGCFDAILNIFTSFGYFDTDEENFQVIRQAFNALNEKGWLFFDYMNTERVLSELEPKSETNRNGMHIIQERAYKPDTKRIEKTITVSDKLGLRSYRESVRAYSRRELYHFFEQAGFSCKYELGDYKGRPFDVKSARLVMIGQKNV
ncbi:methyltransferase domain-containing protein [candidate division KSB1 bacterium]|nr:methyltransferase domain-containing protein [candidate division KSB1 bacterium]